ncbi:hypothetical protein [Arthrobacter sp. NPDC057013]|uniref:hypothetical protein n=1 Tax=Arthrobacter sp. NPDC057013 TaxID=3345999 RepID=UPI003642ADBD
MGLHDEAPLDQGLLAQVLDERRTHPVEAKRRLERFVRSFDGTPAPYDAQEVLADFYFLEGDFASGYALLGEQATPSLYLTLAEHLNHPPLTAWQVFKWAEYGITKKGFEHVDVLLDALQVRLDDFHSSHGVSLVQEFWTRITADGPVDDIAATIEGDVAPRVTGESVRSILADALEATSSAEPLRAFEGFQGYEEPIQWPRPWVAWSLHFILLHAKFRILVRDAENAARDAAKIPRVGEGWVSEMALLREIQAAFPDERVVHQGRPGWLAPQSLDIYLPKRNIGIEYQGAQHAGPVEYFGGAKAFELQQERDARKSGLCDAFGCQLIEVHPGYRIEEVVAHVKNAISKVGG